MSAEAWDGMGVMPAGERPSGHVRVAQAPAVPCDHDAERAVLGAALLDPNVIPELAAIVRDDDWHHPAHVAIWHTITDRHATGQPVDVLTVGMSVGTDRQLAQLGGPLYVSDLTNACPVIASATYYARVVADRAGERRTVELGRWLEQAGHDTGNADLVRERIQKHLGDRNPADRARVHVTDVDEFLDTDDDEYDWVIPGLLERHDRLMLTGPEGGGKSTLCRQAAVMAAAGMHPLTGDRIPPVRVLLLDLENSRRQSRRKLRPLRVQAGAALVPERLRIQVRPSGIDLLNRDDVAWLLSLIDEARPDLLITGPIYRMATGDPTEEKIAKPVSVALDRVREAGCAVLIETHTPHATNGQKKRPTRPYGASLWLRWPEFGIHLSAEGELEHWRGPRDEREWPGALRRGGHWPWTPVVPPPDPRWSEIHTAITSAGERLSNRELTRRTGIPEATVRVLVERNSRRLAALLDHLSEVPKQGEIDDA